MGNKKVKLLLAIILALAFFLRIWGIDYGLPYFFIGDEQPLVAGALKMAQLKTLLPVFHPEEFRLLYYPPLMSYIYLAVLAPFILVKYLLGSWSSLTAFQNYLILNPGFVWLIARIITALMGLASIYLIYLIGRKIFNQWAGLLAALFLSLSFFHVQLSHFTRHWLPAVFFTYLVVWLAFAILENPQRKYYFWAGIGTGLAFGVSYITAVVLLVVLLVHFLKGNLSLWQKIKDKNLWLFLIVFVLVCSIFVLLHPQEFFRLLWGEDSTLVQSKNLFNWLASFGYYFKTLFFLESAILIFSLWGWLILWFKSKKIWLLFSFWPIFYITILYVFFHLEARYIVLLIPWLALLAGYGLYFFLEKISKKLVIALILLLVFSYPLLIAMQYDNLLSQEDTRLLAQEWVIKNVPSDNKIITDWSDIKILPNKESLLLQKQIDEQSLRTDDRLLLSLNDKEYPSPSFYLLSLHFIGEKLPNDLSQYVQENNYQYFIVQYWQKQDLTEQDKSIIKQGQLVKKFETGLADYSPNINGDFLKPISLIFSLKRLGPIVEIYQL